jgi:hypothetical protein
MPGNFLILHRILPMLIKIVLHSEDPILPERGNSEHRFSRFRAVRQTGRRIEQSITASPSIPGLTA